MTKIFLVKDDNNLIESKMFYSLEAARKYFFDSAEDAGFDSISLMDFSSDPISHGRDLCKMRKDLDLIHIFVYQLNYSPVNPFCSEHVLAKAPEYLYLTTFSEERRNIISSFESNKVWVFDNKDLAKEVFDCLKSRVLAGGRKINPESEELREFSTEDIKDSVVANLEARNFNNENCYCRVLQIKVE
jgi:hypothetical protein